MGKQKLHKPAVVSAAKDKNTPPKKVAKDSDEDSSSSSSSEEEVGMFLQQTTIKKNTAVTKQPVQKQPPKSGAHKAVSVESSSDDEDSDSDEEVPQQTKQISPAKKQSEVKQQTKQISPANKQSKVPQQTKQISPAKKQSEVPQQTKQISPAKKQSAVPQQTKQISPVKKQSVAPVGAAKKVEQKAQFEDSSSEEEDSDEDDSEDEEQIPTSAKQTTQKQNQVPQVSPRAAGQKAQVVESSSEDEDDSDEDNSDAEKEAPKAVKQIPQQKKPVPQVSPKAAGQKAQFVESSSEEEDDSDEDDSDAEKEAPKAVKQILPQKKEVLQVGAKAAGQKTQVAEGSSEDEDDSDEDDTDEDDSEEEKKAPESGKQIPVQKKQGAQKQAQVDDSEEDSSEDDEEDSSEDDEEEDYIPAGKIAQVTKSINGVKTALTNKSADVEDTDSDEDEEEEEEEEETIQSTHKRKGDKAKEQPPAKKQKLKGDGGEALKVPESKKRKREVKKEPNAKKQKPEAANGSEGPVTLYVGHLDNSTTEEEITSFFSKNNISLAEVRKLPNKSTAFVDLEDADDLDDALALNGITFKNNTIAVERAKPRTPAQAALYKKVPSTFIPGDTSNKSENEKDSRTLFVKNLPESATSESLKSIFDSALYIRIPEKEGVRKGFGFIEFADKTSMEAAISENQGVEFEGSSLFLDYVGSRSTFKKQRASPGTKPGRGGSRQANSGARGDSKVLFVKNLSYSTDESSLKASFKGALSARIPIFQESGKSRGFAFVDFPTAEAAAKAFDAMSGQTIDGRQVTLDFAVDKNAAGAGGRGGFSSRGRGGKSGGKSFRGGAAGGQKGRGGFNKAKGGIVPAQGKKTKFSEDSD